MTEQIKEVASLHSLWTDLAVAAVAVWLWCIGAIHPLVAGGLILAKIWPSGVAMLARKIKTVKPPVLPIAVLLSCGLAARAVTPQLEYGANLVSVHSTAAVQGGATGMTDAAAYALRTESLPIVGATALPTLGTAVFRPLCLDPMTGTILGTQGATTATKIQTTPDGTTFTDRTDFTAVAPMKDWSTPTFTKTIDCAAVVGNYLMVGYGYSPAIPTATDVFRIYRTSWTGTAWDNTAWTQVAASTKGDCPRIYTDGGVRLAFGATLTGTAVGGNVWLSEDGGANWALAWTDPTVVAGQHIHQVIFDPDNVNRMVVEFGDWLVTAASSKVFVVTRAAGVWTGVCIDDYFVVCGGLIEAGKLWTSTHGGTPLHANCMIHSFDLNDPYYAQSWYLPFANFAPLRLPGNANTTLRYGPYSFCYQANEKGYELQKFNGVYYLTTLVYAPAGSGQIAENVGVYASLNLRDWTTVYRGTEANWYGARFILGVYNGKLAVEYRDTAAHTGVMFLPIPQIRTVNTAVVEKGYENVVAAPKTVYYAGVITVAAGVATFTSGAVPAWVAQGDKFAIADDVITNNPTTSTDYVVETRDSGTQVTITDHSVNRTADTRSALTDISVAAWPKESSFEALDGTGDMGNWLVDTGDALNFTKPAGGLYGTKVLQIAQTVAKSTTSLALYPGTMRCPDGTSIRPTVGKCISINWWQKKPPTANAGADYPRGWYTWLTKSGGTDLAMLQNYVWLTDNWHHCVNNGYCNTDPGLTLRNWQLRMNWATPTLPKAPDALNPGGAMIDSVSINFDTDRYRSLSSTFRANNAGTADNEFVFAALPGLGRAWSVSFTWRPLEGSYQFLADVPIATIEGTSATWMTLWWDWDDRKFKMIDADSTTVSTTVTFAWSHWDTLHFCITTDGTDSTLYIWTPEYGLATTTTACSAVALEVPTHVKLGTNHPEDNISCGRFAGVRAWTSALNSTGVAASFSTVANMIPAGGTEGTGGYHESAGNVPGEGGIHVR
jgi:hypothetical protein